MSLSVQPQSTSGSDEIIRRLHFVGNNLWLGFFKVTVEKKKTKEAIVTEKPTDVLPEAAFIKEEVIEDNITNEVITDEITIKEELIDTHSGEAIAIENHAQQDEEVELVEEDGFFRIQRLYIQKAKGLETIDLKNKEDFSLFLSAQGADCQLWGRLVPHDSSTPDVDEEFLVAEDGSKVIAKWRANNAWLVTSLSPDEPTYKMHVFNVEHPHTRVVQFELVEKKLPYVGLIKFLTDGQEDSGYARPNRIYCDGKRVPRNQFKNLPRVMDVLRRFSATRTSWALISPGHCHPLREKDKEVVTVDGKEWRPRFYAYKIWFGGDGTPPNDDLDDGKETLVGKRILDQLPLPVSAAATPKTVSLDTLHVRDPDIIRENVVCNIVSIFNDMIQLIVAPHEDLGDELKEKTVAVPRTRVFIDGKPFFKGRHITGLRESDFTLFCTLAKKPDVTPETDNEKIFSRSDFFGVVAWNDQMPEMSTFITWMKYRRQNKRCKIKAFIRDEEGRYIGGIAQLAKVDYYHRTKAAFAADPVRICFDRSNVVAANVSLANVDLGYFATIGDFIYIYHEAEKMTDMTYLTSHNIPVSRYTWYKAEVASLDGNIPFEFNQKFDFDPESKDVKNFLKKHQVPIEEFGNHLSGETEPKVKTDANKNENALRIMENNNPFDDEGDNIIVPEDCCLAQVIHLDKPKRQDMPVSSGLMEIVGGPHVGAIVHFNRSNVYIFGRCLGLANLTDLMVHSDHFVVYLGEDADKKLKVVSAWKGPRPGEMMDELELYSKQSFKTWISRHKLANASMFHALADGLMVRRPWFPLKELQRFTGQIKFISSPISPVNKRVAKQFGLIEVLEGEYHKEFVIFEAEDLYIYGVNIMTADIRKFLKPMDRVSIEVAPLNDALQTYWRTKFDELRKKQIKVPDTRGLAHKAQILYIGARPKPPSRWHTELTLKELETNYKLREYINKRDMTVEIFYKILTSSAIYEKVISFDSNPAMAPGFLQAEMLVHRSMLCTSVDDPNIASIVNTAEEMETALFLSKTLESAVQIFTGQRPLPGPFGLDPLFGSHAPRSARSVSRDPPEPWGTLPTSKLPSLMSINTAPPRRSQTGRGFGHQEPDLNGFGGGRSGGGGFGFGGYNLGRGGYSRSSSLGDETGPSGFGGRGGDGSHEVSNKRRLSAGVQQNAKRNRGQNNWGEMAGPKKKDHRRFPY